MSVITIRTVSIIIFRVNDAFCYYPSISIVFLSPPIFIIDNIFLSLSCKGDEPSNLTRTFFIQRFFYLKWRESSAVSRRIIEKIPEMNPSQYYTIFFIHYFLFLHFFPSLNYEKKGRKIVSSCANLECEKISTRLRVYNVFFCLLSFWCFTLEWTLLAFRRYRYEYDAWQGWIGRWCVIHIFQVQNHQKIDRIQWFITRPSTKSSSSFPTLDFPVMSITLAM